MLSSWVGRMTTQYENVQLVSCRQDKGMTRELKRRTNSSSAGEAGSVCRRASSWQSQRCRGLLLSFFLSPFPVCMDSTASRGMGKMAEEQPGLGMSGVNAPPSFWDSM